MESYGEVFAKVYDLRWGGFVESIAPKIVSWAEARREQNGPGGGHGSAKTVLDVGCGTGLMARAFLDRGWKVTGIDLSYHMLAIAGEKNAEAVSAGRASFHEADAASFSLPEKTAFAVSTFDMLNHLPSRDALRSSFRSVRDALLPGGWFLFDLNTERGLRQFDYISIHEDDVVTIINRGVYAPASGRSTAKVTGFLRDQKGGRYRRFDEVVEETRFFMKEVRQDLEDVGFGDIMISTYTNLNSRVADPEAVDRVVFTARNGEENRRREQ